MRLFIGIWLDDAAVTELSDWAYDAQALCGGRIMCPADMHLTVAFLGHAEPEQADALARAAQNWPVRMQPFRLTRFGMFERARVVWAGPAEDDPLPWLFTLYDTLWSCLMGMGWRPPESVFRPHVSLLRSARVSDVGVLHRPAVLARPQRCVLVASRPGEFGSNYEVLTQLPVA